MTPAASHRHTDLGHPSPGGAAGPTGTLPAALAARDSKAVIVTPASSAGHCASVAHATGALVSSGRERFANDGDDWPRELSAADAIAVITSAFRLYGREVARRALPRTYDDAPLR